MLLLNMFVWVSMSLHLMKSIQDMFKQPKPPSRYPLKMMRPLAFLHFQILPALPAELVSYVFLRVFPRCPFS